MLRRSLLVSFALVVHFGCSSSDGAGAGTDGGATGDTSTVPIDTSVPGTVVTLGEEHAGDYHLGPVEWTGSFNNSCSPYQASTQAAYGQMLAGVELTYNGNGQLCDACILIKTRMGKSVIARVVTTGEAKHTNDVDVSSAAYDLIHVDDPTGTADHPRPMTWQVVKCPDDLKLAYQFQGGSNVWWTSFWVRNPKTPIAKVEVKSTNHADFAPLRRGDDGTYTDDGGFGEGAFTLRITSIDGKVVTDTFPKFDPGGMLPSSGQLD
jgi:hypothetical protein